MTTPNRQQPNRQQLVAKDRIAKAVALILKSMSS